MFDGYYDFPLRVAFFKVPESLSDFIQPVTLVDDWRYLPRLHQIGQDGQILPGYSCNKRDEFLAYEP